MRYPCKNIFSLARRTGRPLILDGAMGSLLQQSGVRQNESLWTSLASVNQPEMVLKIHRDYISSGADIITTNTFRSNPFSVESSDYQDIKSEVLVRESLNLAKLAVKDEPILIAGSNAPAENCYKKERTINGNVLESNHHRHIDLLMKYGCDFILNETQSHSDEIEIICRYCNINEFPFVLSFFLTEDLELLSGEKIFDVLPMVLSYQPLAVGFNCIAPEIFNKLLKHSPMEFNWGFYLNCGSGSITDKDISCGIDESAYWDAVKSSLRLKPGFIGACCGSNPNHIKRIRDGLNGIS